MRVGKWLHGICRRLWGWWRFWSQAAIREGRWKLLHQAGEPDRLFDLESDRHERRDLAAATPDVVAALRRKLEAWADRMQPRGMPADRRNKQERGWYQEYFPRGNPPIVP